MTQEQYEKWLLRMRWRMPQIIELTWAVSDYLTESAYARLRKGLGQSLRDLNAVQRTIAVQAGCKWLDGVRM